MHPIPVQFGRGRAMAAALFIALAAGTLSAQSNQWYVDAGVKMPGNGKSWGAAFATLPAALSAARSGDTVRVAVGTFVHLTVHDNVDNGLHFFNTASQQVFNCIFSNNTGRGMCHISAGDKPVVENNLFFGNRIAPYHYRGTDYKTVAQLNQLGYATGNLAGDPDYLETVRFTLGANSAAVDQGRDRIDFPGRDIHLEMRGHDDVRRSGPAGHRDMGAVAWRGSALKQGGSASPGGAITFGLDAPSDGGLAYQAGSALGDGPIAIDTRQIRLGLDPLLELTLRGLVPQIFGGYAGRLDSAGKATASVLVPNHAALKGFTFHTAFVTLSGTAPSGVKTISESLVVRIQ